MRERQRIDGFHVASGAFALVSGPVMLASGAPAGWTFLLIAAGVVLLGSQWAIVHDVDFGAIDATAALWCVVGAIAVAVAVVYLTRAADDLPSLFPGHDGDSEHFRIVPGVVTLVAGAAVLVRTFAATRLRPRTS